MSSNHAVSPSKRGRDMWNDAVGYENCVGRWSRAIAPLFLDWLNLPSGIKWLDVACGTGALTSAILAKCNPAGVTGIDKSADYLGSAKRSCQDFRAQFTLCDGNNLSFPSSSFDVSVSALALNFMDYRRVLAEQHRVIRPGGTIAAYVWDYSGEYEFARRFWDAALSVDPRASAYDPGRKATICREENLHRAVMATGCTAVETCSIDHAGQFPSRESYWDTFDARQGSTFEYLSLLTSEQRIQLKESLLSTLPAEGPVTLNLRALAVNGRRQ